VTVTMDDVPDKHRISFASPEFFVYTNKKLMERLAHYKEYAE
jgi:hypothetical protein